MRPFFSILALAIMLIAAPGCAKDPALEVYPELQGSWRAGCTSLGGLLLIIEPDGNAKYFEGHGTESEKSFYGKAKLHKGYLRIGRKKLEVDVAPYEEADSVFAQCGHIYAGWKMVLDKTPFQKYEHY
jgi:hypothetical protein